ncbi:helix-turn-helix transcriptional regulator [Rhodococcus erythropolis]|uniref:helix-turn-helix transcriptional regulator n=1 Tax=Rhodococcus erythropolis TaxID=1833 RepID=UPI002093B41F|nr:WYL domain-containing protein [Rhodococcus erythropolis]
MRRADDDIVDPEALSVLAAACRDHEHVRFDYRRGDGESSRRLVEPHRLVTAGRLWYLVAWDHHRADWRTFRLDRLSEPWLAGSHFTPREIPGGDAAAFVARSVGSPPRHHDAKLAIEATFADLEGVLRWIDHTPIEVAADRCLVEIRSEDLGRLAMTVARIALTAPVVVIEPTELADTVSRSPFTSGSRHHDSQKRIVRQNHSCPGCRGDVFPAQAPRLSRHVSVPL